MTKEQLITRPIKEVIRNVARSVAESQEEMDRRSIEVQKEIEAALESGELDRDIDASWLKFSEVDVDLEVAVSLEGQTVRDERGKGRKIIKPFVGASPMNPRLRDTYDYESDITSTVSLKIVPVPPEKRTE